MMASNTQNNVEQQQPAQSQRIQIYPTTNPGVSPFWRDKYERDAKKYWDQFYRRHQDRFFKDRHYLDKEWDQYFSGSGRKVILEVGCGAGNAVFPLIATYPDVFVHACDFSPRAVNLVKAHKEFTQTRVSAFVCDLTTDDLSKQISPASVDVVTMIFVLSAVSPEKMPSVLQNIKKVLKPNGYVLFRDYAVGDLAQEDVVDMSEGMAVEMFGVPTTNDNEVINIELDCRNFKIKVLSKEYQHTCKSTGLMLWESARLMAAILARNPNIVAGKRVLELGCGCGGICSMVAVRTANTVVATDGDRKALELLTQNITSNLRPPFLTKLITKRLEWGNRDDIEAIKALNPEGFDLIIGTDVTYIPEAILPLFSTARDLMSSNRSGGRDEAPALILCHIFRRVDEPSLLSAASQFGFRLVDKWAKASAADQSQSLISSWFPEDSFKEHIPTSALNIMYFQID
ncbi:S-adenosyl-L-methionine-dependent methyltransferases superfamily protein isoform 4 [Theobroma cacao]|uniref:S-adenosyl-L-methionine-dependent methyltransferases superfamily protein isoform 4 n=1 Tax=Theobroma cacao TaxID=3641 RepID=A0A061GLA7_THECC|nr:S-adenosyl-L-methionine-dependent methyltransferases superfamily protein isoform 4 [Theobroma cacao]